MKMKLRVGPFVVALTLIAASFNASAAELKPVPVPPGAKALRDIPYVENGHERQKLDLYLPEKKSATPLVIYIHGGGFTGGGKESLNPRELRELLDAGIAVAALNYRLIKHAPLPAAFQDCARAVQFLRSKAGEWNLDQTRLGAFGGSAGAQLAMYLAFHDDLADPNSTDPIARQSTRLACVAPSGGQVTIDADWWIAHVPGYEKSHVDPLVQFGVKTREEALPKIKAIAALELLSRDDPPVFMSYGMAPGQPYPDDRKLALNWRHHHVVHGVELKKLADPLGVEIQLKYPGAKTRYGNEVEFFKAKLLTGASAKAAGQ